MKKILFILGKLNNDDLDWMLKKSRKKTIYPGTILIHEGQTIDALYIVLSGTLSISIESLDNKELAMISTGEVVGEISFIDTRPPLATVKAIEECQVLAIPRLQLTAKIQQDMGFASRFYHAISLCLAARMRGTVRRLGYGLELEESAVEQEDLDPIVLENMQLAQAKFDWLMDCLASNSHKLL
jgi:bacteriocin-type transport-associated protein